MGGRTEGWVQDSVRCYLWSLPADAMHSEKRRGAAYVGASNKISVQMR